MESGNRIVAYLTYFKSINILDCDSRMKPNNVCVIDVIELMQHNFTVIFYFDKIIITAKLVIYFEDI